MYNQQPPTTINQSGNFQYTNILNNMAAKENQQVVRLHLSKSNDGKLKLKFRLQRIYSHYCTFNFRISS